MFLSYKEVIQKENNLNLKRFENEELHQFYETKMFPNALCTKYNPKRPDILAVAAYDEDKIIGMAGCSDDTPLLWQIGFDVNENYCGKGIGTYLVTLLKNELEKRKKFRFMEQVYQICVHGVFR
jgi:RimJ/RimL family protein N-acetyltransferase